MKSSQNAGLNENRLRPNGDYPSLERPAFLAGFGHNCRAESIHDDLFARALAISTEQTTLVFCSVDLIGLFASDIEKTIRQVNRPEAQIILPATHTHHGPDTVGLWGPDDTTRGVEIAQRVNELCPNACS